MTFSNLPFSKVDVLDLSPCLHCVLGRTKVAEILLEAGGNLQEALKLLERVESAQLVKRYTLEVYGIPTTFKPPVTTFTPVLDGGLYGTGS